MGGLKRKIPTDKKIEKKESKSVAFSKRRKGLFSKTAQLCVLSGAQVAILATPPCSKSNVSFYSFGHSSVDSVVSAFLKNEYPREDHLGSEFWWEDKRLSESEDPKELSEAVDSISRMMQNLKGLRSKALATREDAKKKRKEVFFDQSQTLNLQSAGASRNLYGCYQEFDIDQIFDFVESTEDLSMNSEMDVASMIASLIEN
ncbi:BnaC09g50730D [Brassica napus]|uniref:BnaC09g50730D protein n=1 Tax=Brassica napus TaxID=3708 RepID=A0A078I6W1_BRANA|nr:BnaC09g50730D [Brassica napus]